MFYYISASCAYGSALKGKGSGMKVRSIKILVTAVTAAIGLAMTGCSFSQITGVAPEPKITGAYETECTVTAYIVPPGESADSETEFCFGGHVKRLGTQFWEMSITSPDSISGLEITKSDIAMSSRLDGLSFDLFTEEIPSASPVAAVFNALDNAAAAVQNGGKLASGENGGWVMNGSDYTIIFDSTGAPVSMSLSTSKITAEFTSFCLISESGGTAALPETTAEVTEITSVSAAETSETAAVTAEETTVTASETSALSETTVTVTEEEISTLSETTLTETSAETEVTTVPVTME